MKKGVRRGCVRLKGAVIGIDDQDVNTFTITVDHKTFHFQVSESFFRCKNFAGAENRFCRHAMGKSVKSGCGILRKSLHGARIAVAYITTLRKPFKAWVDRQQVSSSVNWQCLIEKSPKPTRICKWWSIRQRKSSNELKWLKAKRSAKSICHF